MALVHEVVNEGPGDPYYKVAFAVVLMFCCFVVLLFGCELSIIDLPDSVRFLRLFELLL